MRVNLVAVLLLACPLLFALGSGEVTNDSSQKVVFSTTQGAGRALSLSVGTSQSLGVTILEVTQNSNIFGNLLYRTGLIAAMQEDPVVQRGVTDDQLESALFGDKSHQEDFAPVDQKGEGVGIGNVVVYYGTLSADLLQRARADTVHAVKNNTFDASIASYGSSDLYKVVLIHDSGNWERLEFSVNMEFFEGESELFAKGQAGESYNQKALAFLYTFFTPGDAAAGTFKQAAVGSGQPAPGNWDEFRSELKLADYQKSFKGALFGQFTDQDVQTQPVKLADGGTANVPFFRLKPGWFQYLYGARRSAYVSAYLRFLCFTGKPLFSYGINSSVSKLDPGYAYDRAQYVPLTAIEGQSLATAALRYLTWGVEYTLPQKDKNTNIVAVYSPAAVDPWLDNKGTAEMNYLSSAPTTVTAASGTTESFLLAGSLTTPFAIRGNPLPYVCGGIDSPRVFAYKMREQTRVRTWAWNNGGQRGSPGNPPVTTAAWESNWKDGYVDEMDLYRMVNKGSTLSLDTNGYYKSYITSPITDATKGVLKPFMPGLSMSRADWGRKDLTVPGPYNPDKLAGVDCVGLLMGGISMCGFRESVYGATNKQPAKTLDNLNQLSASVGKGLAGLDSKGTPAFYPIAPNVSVVTGDYRMSRADLERSTCLVSDLSDIQPGDLLLSDTDSTELSLGIVVGFESGADKPSAYKDGSDYLSHVAVLFTNATTAKVALGRWTDVNFTATPTGYQVRRLLKLKTGGNAASKYQKDSWDLLDGEITDLSITFAYQGDKNWIPNTGDYLRYSSITISKMNSFGGTVAFTPGEDSDVTITATDRGYQQGDKSQSNIYNNKGGGFEFCAFGKNGSATLLANLERDGGVEDPPGVASAVYRYKVIPNKAFFDDSGKGTGGCRLYVDGDQLTFVDTSGSRSTLFGIRPEAGAAQRPGDDLMLGFALADNWGVHGQAAESDFVALIDSRMLWRAELYIDETRSEDGTPTGDINKDWNNLHPWNDPVNNDWFVAARDGADKDGGQIRIASWTHFNGDQVTTSNGQRKIGNTVAYNMAGFDSPFIFNDKMSCQALALDKKNGTANVSTLAPPAYPGSTIRDWTNYVGVTEVREIAQQKKDGTLQGSYYAALRSQMISKFAAYTAQQKPYIPSLAIYFYYFFVPGVDYSDSNTMTVYGAGTQCSGIVQRAMGYKGNSFPIIRAQNGTLEEPFTDDIRNDDWSSYAQAYTQVSFFANDLAHEIMGDQVGADLSYPTETDKPIIPGDVFWFDFGAGGNHIGIVQSVKYQPDGRTLKPGDVVLIEAAGGVDGNRPRHVVMNRETWKDYQKYRVDNFPNGVLHFSRLNYQ